MAGAAAAVAGPLAIAVAAAGVTKKAYQTVGEAATRAGDALSGLAKGDNAGALLQVGEGAADLVGKFGLLGQVTEAQIKAGLAVADAFGKVTRAFVDRGRELAGYEGHLAGAAAKSDLRSLQ